MGPWIEKPKRRGWTSRGQHDPKIMEACGCRSRAMLEAVKLGADDELSGNVNRVGWPGRNDGRRR